MKTKIIFFVLCALYFCFLAGCNPKDTSVRVENLNGNKLYVCDLTKVTDSIVLPLSEIVESIHITRLDTAKEGLIAGGIAFFSDNYIGIKSWGQVPFKLYDKNGKFIRNVGTVGKGPNEYMSLYCAQIDEKNGQVYLLPWQSQVLLCYDLETGEAKKPIPLVGSMPKGNFQVMDNKVLAMALPIPGAPYFVFYQDLEGNVIDTVPARPYLETEWGFSNEISSDYTERGNSVYVFRWNPRLDSLYHYDTQARKLYPVFTVDFGAEKIPMHVLRETSDYYYAEMMEPVRGQFGGITVGKQKYVLVNKKNPGAKFFKIENDFFGGLGVSMMNDFNNGMFAQNYPAVTLKEKLSEIAKKPDLQPSVKQRIDELLNGLEEDDNNVIIWGKLK